MCCLKLLSFKGHGSYTVKCTDGLLHYLLTDIVSTTDYVVSGERLLNGQECKVKRDDEEGDSHCTFVGAIMTSLYWKAISLLRI